MTTCDVGPVIAGTLDVRELEALPSKVIRVHICSSGPDTICERDAFLARVYPKLRAYCRLKYGLDFQAVDLHWGNAETWTNNNSEDRKLCLEEIQQSQRLSAGPTFVALLTQKYGECLLPDVIPAQQYDVILDALRQHKNRETRDAYHLEHWYSRDDNSVPAEYVLQREEHVIRNTKPQTDLDKAIYGERSAVSWADAKLVLRRLLSRGIEYCLDEGSLVHSDVSHFFTSELEAELNAGIALSNNPEKCFTICREIVDLKNYVSHPLAPNFMEICEIEDGNDTKLVIDPDSETKRLHLYNESIGLWLPENETDIFSVLWKNPDGIDDIHHVDYVEDVCASFENKIKQSLDRQSGLSTTLSKTDQEIVQHWTLAKENVAGFVGRDVTLGIIKSYLLSNDSKPLVLYGETGLGKTTLVAKAASELNSWVEESVLTVVRFIGHTDDSSHIRSLLQGICDQLIRLFAINHGTRVPKTYKDIEACFTNLLAHVPEDQNLVIFLDSLHELSSGNDAHLMKWLPKTLQSNVKIVLTLHPEASGLLQKIKTDLISGENNFLEVPAMDPQELTDMLTSLLILENRTLQPEQFDFLHQHVFGDCQNPLFVKLILGNARLWSSSDDISQYEIPANSQDYIKAVFQQLEIRHGPTFTQRALGYLTSSESGLGDCEMEDILSLDDAVLNEIIPEFDGSVRRLPTIAWLRLKYDIRDFLCNKETQGTTVCAWNSTMFSDVARELYLSDPLTTKEMHAILADYFLGTWAGRKKPYTRPSSANNNEVKGEADRLVPTQPLTFDQGPRLLYNIRKFSQLPRHLHLAGRFTELGDLVLFSFEWMFNKTNAMSLDHLLADFSLHHGVEVTLVEKALRDAQPFINQDISNMAAEMSGRLLPYLNTHPNVRRLIQNADAIGLSECAFMPNFPYHQIPGSPLKYSIPCEPKFTDLVLKGHGGHVVLAKDKEDNMIKAYDSATGEEGASIFSSVGSLYISPDGQRIVIVDHLTEKTVKIHDADSGKFLGQLIPLNQIQIKPKEKYKLTDVTVSNDHVCMTVTTDKSYLFIADLHECKFVHVQGLEGRSSVCRITPDSKYVFCSSGETLLSYSLGSVECVTTTTLEQKPQYITFNSNTTRAFVINGIENKIFMMTLSDGSVDFLYKVVLQESFQDDIIVNLSLSQDENLVLVQGESNIVVYNITDEKICCHFDRPGDVPQEFKLPGAYYEDIIFTQAHFSPDDKFVIASMFRNIYIWNVSNNRLLTSLKAPVGIIQDVLLPGQRGQIISHSKGSDILQVWSIGDAIGHVGMLDKLTAPIETVKVSYSDKCAFIKCVDSDEIGVLSMSTGKLVDLLTHEKPLRRFEITSRGDYVFVALDKDGNNTSNKIWYVPERKIIYEFGNDAAYFVAMTTEDSVFSFCKEKNAFRAPYKMTQYKMKDNTFSEYVLEHEMNFLICDPFITPEDKYLVTLNAEDYDVATKRHKNPSICALSLKGMNMSTFTTEYLSQKVKINRILHVRPCPTNSYTIVVLFTDEPDPEQPKAAEKSYSHCYSFMIFDICSGVICQVLEDFLAPQTPMDRLLFTNDVSLCVDHESNVFDMGTGYFVKQICDRPEIPSAMALQGRVVVYASKSHLSAYRIADLACIGTVNIHGHITSVSVCHDDRTLVVGCKDGSVTSYVLVDQTVDDSREVLQQLPSRQLTSDQQEVSSCPDRTWDKVNSVHGPPYSRPPSAMVNGPRDRDVLKKIKPVPRSRPHSNSTATTGYLNSRSRACVLQ